MVGAEWRSRCQRFVQLARRIRCLRRAARYRGRTFAARPTGGHSRCHSVLPYHGGTLNPFVGWLEARPLKRVWTVTLVFGVRALLMGLTGLLFRAGIHHKSR